MNSISKATIEEKKKVTERKRKKRRIGWNKIEKGRRDGEEMYLKSKSNS